MKSCRLMPALIVALVFSVAAWAQSSSQPQGSSAQASSSGQSTSAQTSATDQGSSAQSTSGSQANPSSQTRGTDQSGAAATPVTGANRSTGSTATLRGCVTGGAGTYILNASDGTAYTLLGDGRALDSQINHEVEITGTRAAAPVSSQPDTHNTQVAAPGHPSGNNIQVSSMREIADHCAIPK